MNKYSVKNLPNLCSAGVTAALLGLGITSPAFSAGPFPDDVIEVDGGDVTFTLARGGRELNVYGEGDSIFYSFGDNSSPEEVAFSGDVGGIQNLTIRTVRGDDTITVNDLAIGGNLDIRPGQGIDDVDITGLSVAGNLVIRAGRGDDIITVDQVTVDGFASIQGNRGDDTVFLTDTALQGGGQLNAGPGEDMLMGSALVSDAGLRIVRFESDTFTPVPQTFAIGDTGPGGGIVFSVSADGTSGLEAAPVDQSSALWCSSSFTDIEGVENLVLFQTPDPNSGAENTPRIIDVCGVSSAAGVAANYMWPNGQTDGFLPNKEELDLLFDQREMLSLADATYWSSSE